MTASRHCPERKLAKVLYASEAISHTLSARDLDRYAYAICLACLPSFFLAARIYMAKISPSTKLVITLNTLVAACPAVESMVDTLDFRVSTILAVSISGKYFSKRSVFIPFSSRAVIQPG